MRTRVTLVFASFATFCAHAQDVGPWKFGMTGDEIQAFVQFAPYKSFSNGDLETYQAPFAGAKRNFQFYLSEGKLRRIAIRMYEGHDLTEATAAWENTYIILSAQFGAIETPSLPAAPVEDLSRQARAMVDAGSKVQMAPAKQHEGEFVFSTFAAGKLPAGGILYTVTINVDRPRNS